MLHIIKSTKRLGPECAIDKSSISDVDMKCSVSTCNRASYRGDLIRGPSLDALSSARPRACGGGRLSNGAVYVMPLAATRAPAVLMDPDESSTTPRQAAKSTPQHSRYKVF